MKIYLYLRHFPPNSENIYDGLQKAIHGLACGLTAYGAQVTILSEPLESINGSFQSTAGYKIECFRHPTPYRPTFRLSAGLKHYILNELDPNSLVVLNGILHPSIYSVSRLLKRVNAPYVIAPHDVYHPAMFSKNPHLKWIYWYLLEQRVLKQAKAIQVLDIRQAQWLHRLGIKTFIFETPNGFSSDDAHLEQSLTWQQNDPVRLFFFGRIATHHKGLDLLIEALAQMPEHIKVQLTIQGPDQGCKTQLQRQVEELSLTKQVHFLEPDYQRPASEIIANYDIFCLPSRFEGFGMSALEAMLAGRVLLISETAGIAPYVHASNCGVAIAPEVSAIRAGLIELFNCRSKWKEMGLSGRHYALEHLQWERIASDALIHYKKLVS